MKKLLRPLRRRGLALFLVLTMCFSMIQTTAFAAETPPHEHNQDGWKCEYTDPVTEPDCKHTEHDETCGYAAPVEGSPCNHVHNDECGYVAAVEGVSCDCQPGEDGTIVHADGCGYVEAVEGSPCTHVHDENCGYVEAKEGSSCTHECGDECVNVVTEGYWTCVNVVQAFLDAVAAIPEDINAENAEEAGELVNAAFDAYEVLVDAGLDGYDGVAEAMAKVETAYKAIDKALELESSSYGTGTWYDGAPLLGFGAAIGFAPRDTREFPTSDGTQISVIPWDFHNEKHAKDYYYYYDYRIGSKRTDPAPDPVQSSYFEKTYDWTHLDWYAPWEDSKTALAGRTARFGWRQGVTNFNDPAGGLVPTIPSVYLYRLEEITGEEYIAGGSSAIEFHASDEPQLESSGGPAYQPTGPYARIDVPISENAPKGATIQVRFRMAMGYDMEWQASEGTYNWYVQDFILNLTVGEGGSSNVPTADVTKYHDLYIPAGGYSTEMSFVEYFNSVNMCCVLSDNDYVQGNTGVASITESELSGNGGRNTYNDVTIQSAPNANVGDTTTLYATYTATSPYGSSYGQSKCLDVITVHIIEPREVQLDVEDQATVKTLGKSVDGTLSTSGTVFKFNDGDKSIVRGQNDKSTQTMTLTGVSEGTAVIERQYHYYRNNSSTGYNDYLTTYVDIVNVTVGDPKGEDPDSIDGLDITKTANPMTVVGGDEITYIITVTNESGVDKTVTVTDPLPNGVKWKSFTTTAGGNPTLGTDGFTVTWKPTVPAKGSSVLRITCTVDDDARGVLRNVARMVTKDGNKDESTVEPTATPKPKGPNLVITKDVDKASIKVGGTLTYTITVKNTGSAVANNVVVTDQLPDELTYVPKSSAYVDGYGNDTALSGVVTDANLGSWKLGTVAAGKTVKFSFKVTASICGEITNTASVTSDEITTPEKSAPVPTIIYNLIVTKTNTGFKSGAIDDACNGESGCANKDDGSGKAHVHYTVTVQNVSGFDLYGLDILDDLTTVVMAENKPFNGDYTLTIENVKLDDSSAEGMATPEANKSGEDKATHSIVNVLERTAAFEDQTTYTLTYDFVIENNSDKVLKVDLENKATGGTWTTDGQQDAQLLSAARSGGYDIEESDTSGASMGNSGASGTVKPKGIPYKVEHYQQDLNSSGYTLKDTENLSGKTGETVTATAKTYEGFTENTTHIERVPSGKLDANSSQKLVLKLYYDRNTVSYTVKYLKNGTAEELKEPKVVPNQTFGAEVTEEAVSIPGYQADVARQNLVLKTSGNEIVFYYTENGKVTIRYEAGPGGSVSHASESLNPVTGTAHGSAAIAETGYTFDGWYADAAMNTPVDNSWVTNSKIVPAKADNAVWTNAIYYAKFKPNNAYIVFKSNGGSNVDNMTGVTDEAIRDTTMPVTIREGYTFDGWYANEDLSGGKVEALPDKFPAGTTTYYAKWTEKTPLTIEIVGNNETVLYDGNKHEVNGFQVKTTNLPEGISVALASNKTAHAEGTEANTYMMGLDTGSFVLIGTDADQYAVTFIVTDGWLKIKPRETNLDVTAGDVKTIYDGQEHPVTPVVTLDGTTVDNATVTVVYKDKDGSEITSSPKDAGIYTAEITADLNGETAAAKATVIIDKKALSITTDSASKVYDGTALTAPGRIDGLVDGEANFAVTGTRTEVGSSENGYTLTWNGTAKAGNYNITVRIGTLTVTRRYTPPTEYTVTVKYVDEEGNSIAADAALRTTGAYDVRGLQAAIEGYTLAGADRPLTGTVTANTTITMTYTRRVEPTPDEYTITIKYVDEEGNTIAPDVAVATTNGGSYDVTNRQLDLEGYDFVEADRPLTGTVTEDTTITLVYTEDVEPVPDEHTVTVRYVDEAGTVIYRSATVSTTNGGRYDITDRQIDIEGYTFREAYGALTGTITEDTTITLVYIRNEEPAATHTVTWVNWNGYQLEQRTGVPAGTNIPSSAFSGGTPTRPSDGTYYYTFTGWSESVDASGNVTYTAQYMPTLIYNPGTPSYPSYPSNPSTPSTPSTNIPDTNPPLTDTPSGDGTTITDQDVPLAGAVGLNDVDHFAYIIGYSDDTVRPLNNITRAEVATIFFRLMTDEYRTSNWATTNDFSDVAAGNWFNNAISTCANAGTLNGYSDGSFRPNANITRAEFAAIAARFLDKEQYTDDGTGDFSDTADHWAAKEIRLAAKAGWIQGSGNKFRPNDYITRAEVMTIVNRMLDRVPDKDHMLDTMKKWTDNPEDAWYYEAVQEATNEHAYERDELGVVETWTEILTVRDWKALEEEWANANAR